MIDHVKFTAYTTNVDKVKRFLPREEINQDTGNTTFKSGKTKGKGPILKLHGERFYYTGSLHKSYNIRTRGTIENISPFTHSNLIEEIEHIAKEYSLDIDSIRFTRVEVGFNLQMRRPVKDYISSAAYYIGGNGVHYEFAKIPKDGRPFMFKHKGDAFSFKAYDKCEDSNIASDIRKEFDNILRVEIEMRKDAPYFPKSVRHLLEVDRYKGMINTLWKALSQVAYFNIPWGIVDFNKKAAASNQKHISHILLKYAKGKEKEILNEIAALNEGKDTVNNIRKAFRDLLLTIPVPINDLMLGVDILVALDKEAAAYFGEAFYMDYNKYGMEEPGESNKIPMDDDTYNNYLDYYNQAYL